MSVCPLCKVDHKLQAKKFRNNVGCYCSDKVRAAGHRKDCSLYVGPKFDDKGNF